MNTKKITDSEISNLKISSLPTRPTLPTQYGGRGFTSVEMKEAFDALPLFLVEKFNSLIDDVKGEGEASIASEINTGIESAPKLSDIFTDVLTGRLLEYLVAFEGESLALYLSRLRADLDKIAAETNVKL